LPDDARLVVFLGPLDRHRGGHDAIWSFDMAAFMQPKLHLALVGDGPDRPRLEKFARELREMDRVHFLDEQDDVWGLLQRADIVFAPEHGNGSTNAVLEAMAVGRPVLAWRQPHLTELIADGQTGILVRPGDKASLARQTKLLLEDGARRERLGIAARRRAVEQFGVATMAQRYMQLYST
jgi:glycosyltransferase involved in cell wall biosynthesis